jgi:hypothetical protein
MPVLCFIYLKKAILAIKSWQITFLNIKKQLLPLYVSIILISQSYKGKFLSVFYKL